MTDKSKLQVQSNTATGHYYRGHILDEFIQLEMAINQYIVTYFLNDDKKAFEMTFTLLDRMSFEAKRASFKMILDKLDVENGFVKTKSNNYPNSSLLTEIQSLTEIRNYFAHYYLISVYQVKELPIEDNGEVEKVIALAKFRDGFDAIQYTEKELDELITRINIAEKKVNDLKKSNSQQ